MSSKRMSSLFVTGFTVVSSVIAASMLTTWSRDASAQPGVGVDGGYERSVKAWEIQAKTVARDLTLSVEQTTKLVEAYAAARDSHNKAAGAVAGPAERPDFQKMREVNQNERTKFESVLKGFLNAEQIDKALLTLGSFFRRWDAMVETLDAMDLGDKAREDAVKLTADYVAEWNTAMKVAMGSGNRESMREQADKLKEKLDADVARILSAEQMTKWTDATARRGNRH